MQASPTVERPASLPPDDAASIPRKLSIAWAIAIQPEIILIDEPASALDPLATGHAENQILNLKECLTLVIVTHNMQQAARISDYTAFFTWANWLSTTPPTGSSPTPRRDKPRIA